MVWTRPLVPYILYFCILFVFLYFVCIFFIFVFLYFCISIFSIFVFLCFCRVPLLWPLAAAPGYSREISQRLSTQCLSNLFKCHPSFLSKQSFYRLTDRSNPRCYFHLRWSCFGRKYTVCKGWRTSLEIEDKNKTAEGWFPAVHGLGLEISSGLSTSW